MREYCTKRVLRNLQYCPAVNRGVELYVNYTVLGIHVCPGPTHPCPGQHDRPGQGLGLAGGLRVRREPDVP